MSETILIFKDILEKHSIIFILYTVCTSFSCNCQCKLDPRVLYKTDISLLKVFGLLTEGEICIASFFVKYAYLQRKQNKIHSRV